MINNTLLFKSFSLLILFCKLMLVVGCQSTDRTKVKIDNGNWRPAVLAPKSLTTIFSSNRQNLPASSQASTKAKESKVTKQEYSLEQQANNNIDIQSPLPPLSNFLNNIPATTTDEKLGISSSLPVADKGVVRAGLLLPLTGKNGKLGQDMLQAAKLAFFGFADKKIELLIHDTQGNDEGALLAGEMAINDGAQLILGPLLASSVKILAPIAQQANIPVIAFSSDSDVAGGNIFTMGFPPEAQVDKIIKFAIQNGAKTFATIAPENQYGETIVKQLLSVAEAEGASVSRIEFYDPKIKSFEPIVRKIADYDARRTALLSERNLLIDQEDELSKKTLKRLEARQTLGDPPFDALLLADGGARLQEIAALLPFFDIDPAIVRILGTGQWDFEGIGTEPALIGGHFAAPDPKFRENFEDTYLEAFGHAPARLATLAYDAVALASVLAKGGKMPNRAVEAIIDPNGYSGRDGIFRFLPTGIVEHGLAVLRVKRDTSEVVVKSPQKFNTLVN